MTLGNDGIIAKTQSAANAYQNAQGKEEFELAKVANEIEKIEGDRGTVTLTQEQFNALQSSVNKYPDYANRTTFSFTDKSYTVENDRYIQVFLVILQQCLKYAIFYVSIILGCMRTTYH